MMLVEPALDPYATAARWLLEALVRTSIQGGLVIGLVWAVCRLVPRMPPAWRAGLWWLACLKLLVGLVFIEPLALPVLPADSPPSVPTLPAATASPGSAPVARSASPSQDASLAHVAPAARAPSWLTMWPLGLGGLWLAVVAIRLLRLGRHRRELDALVQGAAPAPDDVIAIFDRICGRVRPRQRPALRLSPNVQAPQVLGARRPVILLPVRQLSERDITMTLCHELMHVVRRDLWLGWIPVLAQELFFFHPLARFAAREYRIAREAACDAAVIHRFDIEPEAYGRLLVTLGVSRRLAELVATCGSSSARHLKRRLHMLQQLPSRPSHTFWWYVPASLVVAALVPIQLVAQQRSPATTVTAIDAGLPGEGDQDKYHPWVLLESRDNHLLNGSRSDIARARRFQQAPDDRLLWFRSQGEEYIVRDPAVLAAIEEAFRPLDELGNEQARRGEQQARLGSQQAALGERQALLGEQQARLGAKHAEIAAREQGAVASQLKAAAYAMEHPDGAGANAQQRTADRLLDELSREQESLSKQQAALGLRQEDLGQQQEALSRKQEELGGAQEALGRKQEEASRRAHRTLIELLDKALANGTAQKVG